MQFVIKDAEIQFEDIDYINAHGTSTPLNDAFETKVIKDTLVSMLMLAVSLQSMTDILGAAGGIEAIITTMALKEGFIPPTIHLENPDEECDLDYVPNVGRDSNIKYAISNALGFGGHNAVLVLKKYG